MPVKQYTAVVSSFLRYSYRSHLLDLPFDVFFLSVLRSDRDFCGLVSYTNAVF